MFFIIFALYLNFSLYAGQPITNLDENFKNYKERSLNLCLNVKEINGGWGEKLPSSFESCIFGLNIGNVQHNDKKTSRESLAVFDNALLQQLPRIQEFTYVLGKINEKHSNSEGVVWLKDQEAQEDDGQEKFFRVEDFPTGKKLNLTLCEGNWKPSLIISKFPVMGGGEITITSDNVSSNLKKEIENFNKKAQQESEKFKYHCMRLLLHPKMFYLFGMLYCGFPQLNFLLYIVGYYGSLLSMAGANLITFFLLGCVLLKYLLTDVKPYMPNKITLEKHITPSKTNFEEHKIFSYKT